ncbi:MAG: SH3 domain-containing protein [Notoacmeibacter sp.]|nr:SH3 domain-containing protein [Notoacmeibacter sp.]MCC0031956.1 SH3 domain-containing protein [Brucellaceae bacterium]
MTSWAGRLRAGLTGGLALAAGGASCAEVEFRPDLAEHITALQRIYPAEGPSSVIGNLRSAEQLAQTARLSALGSDLTVIHLSGAIETGDAEKLKAVIEKSPSYNKVIVFESPGGSFLEGFKIAEVLRYDLEGQDPGIKGVYVIGGAQCLSACAIAFALSVDLVHADQADTRFIEHGAQVGFHMGFLPSEKATQQAEVGQVLNLSYDISAAYSRLLNGGANPPSLFREALKHRTQDSFFYLQGNVEAWQMGFSPVSRGLLAHPAYAYGLDEAGAARLCNTLIVHGRAYKSGAELEFGTVDPPEEPKPLEAPEGQTTWFSSGTNGGFACAIMAGPDKRLQASVWRGSRQCADGYRPADEFDVGWCPGKPVGTYPVTAGMIGDAYGCVDGKLHPDIMWNNFADKTRKHPGRVSREVNFRESPDLKAGVIGKLQPGQKVDITGCQLLPDFQAVWYEVDTGSGRGWLSARFVYPYLLQYRLDESSGQ